MPNWKFLEYSKRTPFRPSLGRGRPFPIARLENYNLKEANLVLRRFEDFRSRTPNARSALPLQAVRAAHHPCQASKTTIRTVKPYLRFRS